jgi:hypothetical protein
MGFAKMINLQAFGNRTIHEFPGETMGVSGLVIPPIFRVSITVKRSRPNPASAVIGFLSKSFRERFKGGRHGLG